MPESHFGQLLLAVNCHGWEDFPTHYRGETAEQLLAGWTALWHPTLVSVASQTPSWCSVDLFPEIEQPTIVVVPAICEEQLADADRNRVADFGGHIVVADCGRTELLEKLQAALGDLNWQVSPESAAEFFSLGYAYLQIQLMTRRLRYSTSLDESAFNERLLKAAEHAISDNFQPTTVVPCFDLLIEERLRYYPTTPSIFDYTLLADTTLGKSLSVSLRCQHPVNYQLSADTLELLKSKSPNNFSELKNQVEADRAAIVGGERSEIRNNLVSTHSIIRQLQTGVERYSALLGSRPAVYGRRRFGLDPTLPSLLVDSGFLAAVHSTFDDGTFPQTSENQIDWSGFDDKSLRAIVSRPRDALLAENFIDLAIQLGESIDMGFSATALFVHWPGNVSDAYQDFIRTAKYGEVLGRMQTFEQHFKDAPDLGYSQSYDFDDYVPPFLEQSSSTPNAISNIANYWKWYVHFVVLGGLTTMNHVVQPGSVSRKHDELDSSEFEYLTACELSPGDVASGDDLESIVAECQKQLERFVAEIGGTRDARETVLVVNPCSFSRRMRVAHGMSNTKVGCSTDADADPIYLQDPNQGTAVVDVPAMGFVRLSSNANATEPAIQKGKKVPPMAEGRCLRNEFFELMIDEETGGLLSIQYYHQRTNLLSQRLAYRQQDQRQSRSGQAQTVYSGMEADKIEIVDRSTVTAAIRTSGRLVIEDTVVAEFEQSFRMTRGKPLIELEIELQPKRPLRGNPWKNYIATRFAWGDEAARISGYFHETRRPIAKSRIVSPMAIDIEQMGGRVALLPGGLPYHLSIGYRKMDTLLMVENEQQRKFRIGIAIDVDYPWQAALDWMCDPLVSPGGESENGLNTNHAWLMHPTARNIALISWAEIRDEDNNSAGMRLLMKETEGRPARGLLRSYRPIRHADLTDLLANVREPAKLKDDGVELLLDAHGLIALNLYWN